MAAGVQSERGGGERLARRRGLTGRLFLFWSVRVSVSLELFQTINCALAEVRAYVHHP
jgi:hypothetical protein